MLHGLIKYTGVGCCMGKSNIQESDVAWDDQIYRSGGVAWVDQIYRSRMLHEMIKYTGAGYCMG